LCDTKVDVKFIGKNAEEVAGSCVLIETDNTSILLDYGLEQGKGNIKDFKSNSILNNQIAPSKIDYVLLSHQHL